MYLPGLEHPGDAVPRRELRRRGRRLHGAARARHEPARRAASWSAWCGPSAGGSTSRSAAHPAFDYGRARTEVDIVEGAGAFFSSPAGQLVLRSTVPLVADGARPRVADPVLEEGETLALSLSRRGSPRPLDMVEVEDLLATTLAYWQRWIRRSRYRGRYREMVERSALTLKLLVHQPTGALVAAPTTSLPEAIGGTRNWDYRFTWVRDAAFTVYALMRLGFTEEAAAFMYVAGGPLHARPRPGTGLQILYSIDGGPSPPEVTPRAPARATATRARCGSATAPRTSCSWTSTASSWTRSTSTTGTASRSPTTCGWRSCRQLDWLEEHWEEADCGVWEVRGPTQRFTYSSLMTWVAFERAGRIARRARAAGAAGRGGEQAADRAYLHVQEQRLEPRAPGLRAVPRQLHPRRRRPGHAAGQVHRSAATRGSCPPWTRIEQELVTDSLVHRYHERRQRRLHGARGHLQPVLVLVRRGAHPGRPPGPGAAHVREDADLRQPPRPVCRGDRPVGRGARQLPAGVHAPRP